MAMTDPIADMLTRIRNAIIASYDAVEIPGSKIKTDIAKIMKYEGYIRNYKLVEDAKQGTIVIYLKYNQDKTPVIRGLKRISKPSRRVYASSKKIPTTLNNLGTTIVSTSRGVMTDREARKAGVGGEVVCSVW
jgi:small subunit ribosomal protein S8